MNINYVRKKLGNHFDAIQELNGRYRAYKYVGESKKTPKQVEVFLSNLLPETIVYESCTETIKGVGDFVVIEFSSLRDIYDTGTSQKQVFGFAAKQRFFALYGFA